jgi:hypothetical protein
MNTQKPYWANEVYLGELKSTLRTMENGSWNRLRRNYGKGVGSYETYNEYLSEIEDIKRMISKVELDNIYFSEPNQFPIGMKQASSKEALNHLFNKNK